MDKIEKDEQPKKYGGGITRIGVSLTAKDLEGLDTLNERAAETTGLRVNRSETIALIIKFALEHDAFMSIKGKDD